MKLKKIFILLIILIMIFTYFPIISRADNIKSVETKNISINNLKYMYTDFIKGEKIVANASNKDITLIAVKSYQETKRNEGGDLKGVLTQLYYTSNFKEIKKINLKECLENLDIETDLTISEVRNIYEYSDNIYILVEIQYEYYNVDNNFCVENQCIILKTKDGKTLEEVKIPENENGLYAGSSVDWKIYKYKDIHILTSIKGGSHDGKYYITKDFVKWEKKQLPLDENKKYKLLEVSILYDGISFFLIDYFNGKKTTTISTKDFITYTEKEQEFGGYVELERNVKYYIRRKYWYRNYKI